MKTISFFPLVVVSGLLTLFAGCSDCRYHALSDVEMFDGLSGNVVEGRRIVYGTIGVVDNETNQVVIKCEMGGELTAIWSNDDRHDAKADFSKAYNVQLLVQKVPGGDESITIIKVWDGQQLTYDASLCPLHRVQMERRPEEWLEAADVKGYRSLKYRNSGVHWAVCDSGRRHIVWVCPTCRSKELSGERRVRAR